MRLLRISTVIGLCFAWLFPINFSEAQQQRVPLELSLLVDVSGSINDREFELQKQGYVAAFRSPEIKQLLSGTGIAVNFIYWSSRDQQQEAVPFTLVTATTSDRFADLINATVRPFSNGTQIGPAIDFAVPLFNNRFISDVRVIDVSGDGTSSGLTTRTARDNALAAGITTINGLPIGDSTSLLEFYQDNVIGGSQAFLVNANTFEDFQAAVIAKIKREILQADLCPNDPNKTQPGICGCGIPDTDRDGNGVPECSLEEPACRDGIDNDGDGLVDFVAGSGGDPGCESPDDFSEFDQDAVLRSPAYAKFNSYLGQLVYAEILLQGSRPKTVSISLHNLRGREIIREQITIQPNEQRDVDINQLLTRACQLNPSNCAGFEDLSFTQGAPNGLGRPDGIVDTYGLIRLDFDDSDPSERVTGRVSFYRPNIDGSFSFALSRALRNPRKGKPSYAISNTFDPQVRGFLVPNWAEIIALGSERADGSIDSNPQSFTLNTYNFDGVRINTRKVLVDALGERDEQAGHEFLDSTGQVRQNAYLVEVIPDNPNALYFFSMARYSSNAARAIEPETYNYAFALDAQLGTQEPVFVVAGRQFAAVPALTTAGTTTTWIESACLETTACEVTAIVRNKAGAILSVERQNIGPKAQYHFNASGLLGFAEGSVELSSTKGKFIAQALSYVQSPSGLLQTAYVVDARTRGPQIQPGTFNTNLGMANLLYTLSTSATGTNGSYSVVDFDGKGLGGLLSVEPFAFNELLLNGPGGIGVAENRYGTTFVDGAAFGQTISEVLRVRVSPRGGIDFVIPTASK